jgi:hypothetical protein
MIIQLVQSTHFSLLTLKFQLGDGYTLEDGVYELGIWACETKNLSAFTSWGEVDQCRLYTALRVSMVSQFLLALSVSVSIWWDMKAGRRRFFIQRRLVFDEDGDCELA